MIGIVGGAEDLYRAGQKVRDDGVDGDARAFDQDPRLAGGPEVGLRAAPLQLPVNGQSGEHLTDDAIASDRQEALAGAALSHAVNKQLAAFETEQPWTPHDLRRTALSMLLAKGLSKYDLMVIAGHAKFETTQQFYLAVEDKLVDRARVATSEGFGEILARIWHAPCLSPEESTKKAL